MINPPPELDIPGGSIGKRIAAIRKAKGYAQGQLAHIIGIQSYLLSDFEIGRVRITADMIIRIATVLKVSSDEILGIKGKLPDLSEYELRINKISRRIQKLPADKQEMILQTVEGFLRGNRV